MQPQHSATFIGLMLIVTSLLFQEWRQAKRAAQACRTSQK
jgi:hypothetical protein